MGIKFPFGGGKSSKDVLVLVPDQEQGGAPAPHQSLAEGGEALTMLQAGEERVVASTMVKRYVRVQQGQCAQIKNGRFKCHSVDGMLNSEWKEESIRNHLSCFRGQFNTKE